MGRGDFLNKKDLAAALSGCDVVYHLVSTTLPKTSNDNRLYDLETNVAGTLTLLELVKASRPPMKHRLRLLGRNRLRYPQGGPHQGDSPHRSICAYGIGKLAIEKYLHLYHVLDGIEYRVLRLANPYGEGQRPTSGRARHGVPRQGLAGERIEIWGDGRVVRDYLYVGDAMEAFLKVTFYSGVHRVFNIAARGKERPRGAVPPWRPVAGRRLARAFCLAAISTVNRPMSLDISRAREHLGWEAAYHLAPGTGADVHVAAGPLGAVSTLYRRDRGGSLSLWRNRELISQLTRRDVVGRYRGSLMGLLWSFFNPILMLAVYTWVFSVAFRDRVDY